MLSLSDSRIGVTGAEGFLGRCVCRVLRERGADLCLFEDKGILRDAQSAYHYVRDNRLDYVIHLAGFNGSIEFNRLYPADIFVVNTTLALNIISACCRAETKKFLGVITSCVYPENDEYANSRYREAWLHRGQPNDSIAGHGYAKRNMEIAARLYRRQYGFNAVIACPNTVYGPGDRTDLQRTKVMMAIIKRFLDAKRENASEVVCWGDGSPKREFIFVEDAAELLVRTLERYEDGTMPLNISSGQECTIRQLSELIASRVGYCGKIVWDTSKGNGAMRKALDVSRMVEHLGSFEFTPLERGIERTIQWLSRCDEHSPESTLRVAGA